VALRAPCGSMCIGVQNIRGYYWPEPFKLLKSPEYLLRDWSFLMARPRNLLKKARVVATNMWAHSSNRHAWR
jgi:hypothetical protein